MNLKLLVILCITSLLLLIPIAGATYDVVSGIASNNTEYTTSASYAELHNLSLATGTGTVFIKASWDARVNFTAPLYGRFLRDGASLGRFNLTQSVYAQVGSYELALNETTGTHYYGFEVYSNKKGTIYSRNFSVVFLKNGTYGTGTGGGNVSSVTGAPAGVLDCTGTDEITCTISPQGTNFRNDTISTKTTLTEVNSSAQISRTQVTGQEGVDTTQNTSISNLQVNDSYFNGTVFPNSTNFRNDTISGKLDISTYSGNYPNTTVAGYNGNYPNTTIAGYNGNYPNSSLVNYLLTSTYAGNYPNTSLINYLLISTYAGNFPNSSLANYLLTTTYSGNFPNATVSAKESTWDAKLNTSTYNGNFPNATVSNAANCSAFGSDYYTYNNGSAFLCRQDQTSAFSIRSNAESLITGSATLVDGTGIVMTQAGNNITISSPAAGVTNASVNPYSMNSSNLTGNINQSVITALPESKLNLTYPTHAQNHTLNGTDHTGNLNWSRLQSILVNLSATSNLTGTLADALISSASSWNGRIDAISGTSPIVATESPANTVTITCNQVSASQVGCLDSTNFTTFTNKEPAISTGTAAQFWNGAKSWITLGIGNITALNDVLDAMNSSSATNNTNSQARDDIINSTKVNKTDAGELSGGTLAYSIFPVNITTGTGGISFSNGTNAISVGTSKKMRQATAGIITALYVNQTSDATCSGNVTVTSSGTYKAHINWSNANNASSTGLSATFTVGEWLLYNMTENTECIDFTFVQVHTKTS